MNIETIIWIIGTIAVLFLGWRTQKLTKLFKDLTDALADGKISLEETARLLEDLKALLSKNK